MVERISAQQFADAGLDDWRVLAVGAATRFRTGSFAAGVALVDVIGRLADAADHHPDVDLRYGSVTVRLVTHEVDGLSERDIALAGQISAAAAELGATPEPTSVQDLGITIDARSVGAVRAFWQAVLGYRAEGELDVVDPHGRWPGIWFQQQDALRPQRNRLHVDVFVPHDQAQARVAAALAAGGRLVSDEHAPAWWTLADPEGNEVDVATWQGRE